MVTLVNRYRQRENIGRSECSYCHNGFKKKEISMAILSDNRNLKRIVKIVHLEVRKKMKIFLKKINIKKL